MSLKTKRAESGMTQREAADFFGIKYRTYQNYENSVTSPDMDTAAMFARHFHCTIGDLFDLEEGHKNLLSADENSLLEAFRSMDDDGRSALLMVAKALADKYRSDAH